MQMKIACIIPTLNAGDGFKDLLRSLQSQNAVFDVFVVDSESDDSTRELAQNTVTEVLTVDRKSFNHGGTRQWMVNLKPQYDVYVFLTQDAYLAGSNAIEGICRQLKDPAVGAACGRQLPHKNASIWAIHARRYNYSSTSRLASLQSIPELGLKTAFMSNSFAAYRREALVEVGGFPSHVIFAEDMFVAAKMLEKGWSVAYDADAQVYHSHNYSMFEEGRRYFDMGVFHAREPWIREKFGGASGEGFSFILSELKFLGMFRWYLWPEWFLRNATRFMGYKLGKNERYIPRIIKRKIGMYRGFW